MTIPYIHGLSQSIGRVLTPLDINITFRPFQNLRQKLVHPKDPVPEWKRKGVVYSIPAMSVHELTLGRQADHWTIASGRTEGHSRMGMWRPRQLRNVCSSQATRWTCLKPGLWTHPHTKTRCLLESWHIQHEQGPLNRGRGTMPGLYATLLDHSLHDIYLYLYFSTDFCRVLLSCIIC